MPPLYCKQYINCTNQRSQICAICGLCIASNSVIV
nr:MAG TPA: hypothetical protein [Caudoviricetes sp.]